MKDKNSLVPQEIGSALSDLKIGLTLYHEQANELSKKHPHLSRLIEGTLNYVASSNGVGFIGELFKRVMPNPEMDMILNHLKEIASKIDENKEHFQKIEEKLNDPQNLLFAEKTIHESVQDEEGNKWEFYRNLLLHSLSDEELAKERLNFYKQTVRELSSLELVGLANLYRNSFESLSREVRRKLKQTLAGTRHPGIIKVLVLDLIRLGDKSIDVYISEQLFEKRYFTQHSFNSDLSDKLIEKYKHYMSLDGIDYAVEKFLSSETISQHCFTPWVLDFTRLIATEPGENR